jgi:hypothetical protein
MTPSPAESSPDRAYNALVMTEPERNPYERPRSEGGASALEALDDTELFVQTLPRPIVRMAATCALVLGILLLFLALRLVIATTGTTAALLEVGHVVVGVGCLIAAHGLWRGSVVRLVVGLALMPVALAACAFATITGSLGGLFGAALAILTFVLMAMSFGAVSTMAAARAALGRRMS